MLDAITATEAAPGVENDDFLLVAPTWAIVLDGVAVYAGDDVGCKHGVRWYVGRLATYLGAGLATNRDLPLTTLLRDAIARTGADHQDTCDLSHPMTPGATVAIARSTDEQLEWLVLGDATVSWRLTDGSAGGVTDDRVDRLVGAPIVVDAVRRYDRAYVMKVRNQPGGFWVAAAQPEAAAEALTGALPLEQVDRIGMYSDGITRLVERYGMKWNDLFDLAESSGPRALIAAVREGEDTDPDPTRWRGKAHDDATVVILRRR